MQPVHLPPPAGVHRHRPGVDVPALRSGHIGEGVHRQTDELEQVFRFRVVRECHVGADGDLGDERLSDRHQEAEGAAEEGQGRVETLLRVRVRCVLSAPPSTTRPPPPPISGFT